MNSIIHSGSGSDLVEKFLAALDVKEQSKKTYRRSLRQFMHWYALQGLTNPTRETILEYKANLYTQGLSSLTISSYIVVLRKFFEWAEGMKLYPNIAKGIKGAKRSHGFRKDPLTVPQVKELLRTMKRETVQDLRDFAIVNLLLRTALRTIELSRADVGDIRQQSGEAVLYVHGKGRDSKDEFVILTPAALKPIYEYLKARGRSKESEPLFASASDRNKNQRLSTRSISRIVKESFKLIGIDSDRITAHSLRHTAITLALMGGATIQEAKELARHKSIEITMVYSHNINRIAQAPERKIDSMLE